MRSVLALVFLLATALPLPALAEEGCVITTSTAMTVGQRDVAELYVTPDSYAYLESNGVPGLQRWDPDVNDTCDGYVDSDTLLAGSPVRIE